MVNEAALRIDDVRIDYEGATLLDGVSFSVAPREIVALLGPSGSGKSSLLRCIAGVQRVDSGRIWWHERDVTALPAHRRGFGLVFQDALLFPHLDVGANIAYGLRGRDLSREEVRQRVADLLATVGLAGFERRDVATLSGGEGQRVALARALAPEPRLLLLDEPFGALDRDLRDRLVGEVRQWLHQFGTPAIHVTHDREEADRIADRILRVVDARVTDQVSDQG